MFIQIYRSGGVLYRPAAYDRMRLMLDSFFGLFSHDLGIDLGTANTLVYVRGKGVVIREPSVVAIHRKSKEIIAIGTEAKQMIGKTPANITTLTTPSQGTIFQSAMPLSRLKIGSRK